MRATLLRWLPPAAVERLRARFGAVRFHGDYPSWAAAARDSRGYGAEDILERVMEATLAVEAGQAAFERDSVLFAHIEYSWPVLCGLLWSAMQAEGRLRVLDFGGSLGSSYRQYRGFLKGTDGLQWAVVEQPHFVACGRRHFEGAALRFFPDVESCVRAVRPNVALLSSVLNYLESPYAVLEDILARDIDTVIVDRLPLVEGDRDRICVQTVSKRIYPASYPARFFARRRFLGVFEPRYRLVEEFDGLERATIPSRYQGFIFRRRES